MEQSEIEKLKRMNAFKSDVISISAHELRTSLSALKWILKMLSDGDLGALSSEQNNLIIKAYTSNERMIGLVNEMLSVNHADDTAELKYILEPVDLSELINDVIFDFTGESYKKGVGIIFLKPTAGEHIPMVRGDRDKLRVVLQNLLENAIKYSSQGDKVFLSLGIENDTVTLSVKDTGIGIQESEQSRIFEKFFRADNAKKKENVGSGLGLYTSKKIIEGHGGRIWFDLEKNGGTTFHISLSKA